MSLTDFEVGGYDLLSGMDAESNGGNAPSSNTAAPRFGRRAAPNALDHEALSKDASKRTSTANMPSVNASQDRRDSTTGRRGPKRSLGVIGTDSVKNIDEFSHSVHSSTAEVRLPQIRTSQSRENTANGVAANGRHRLGEGGNAPATRHSMTSPTVNTQVRRGLFDANKGPTATTAAQHYPTRPQSNMETGTAEPTETFLSDRVSVEKGSFTGTRAGWVREQARRLEEQVAAAQALANSPHSLSSIRQRSANSSWRQKMETSMNSISVEKRDVELVRREAPVPLAGTAAVAPTLASPMAPRTSSAPVPTTASAAPPTRPAAASSLAAPPSHNTLRRDLAPIKAPSPAPSVATTRTSLSNQKGLRREASPGAASNASQLNHSGVPDSILSAEYGHALGASDWNHEYDINDITDLFPPAQSMQGKFAIASSSDTQKKKQKPAAAAGVPTRVTPINGTARPSAPTSRQTQPQQHLAPTKLPGKTVSPSAPSSDSTGDRQSPAGITPTNASNASRIAAAASQRSNASAADQASAHVIIPDNTATTAAASPAASKGTKPADGSLYTEEQRAKLEAWQSIPILSYRPADAERYTTACARYFPAQDETAAYTASAAKNLFTFPAPGRAPPEMAGEAVELNYEIHNVLTLMRHRHRKPMWTYPAVLPTDFVAQTRQRRPRTPRSFYGPERPEQGNDWFRKALDDATRVPSPDLTEIEAREAEEKKANPKALKGVDPEVAAAHRKQQEMEQLDNINRAAVPIEA